MKASRGWVYIRASAKLTARMVGLAVLTVAQFLVFPLLLPWYLIRGAHRRAHEREEQS